MNPADLVNRLAGSIEQYPMIAMVAAFAAGVLATTVCPCTVPAGVGIVSYVGTHDPAQSPEDAAAPRRRWQGAVLSIAFFAGLVITLAGLGTAAAVAGRFLASAAPAFAAGTGVVTLAAGIATLFGPRLRERVPDPRIRQRGGAYGAFMYGALFSVATITSSAGPLLLVLTLAAAIGRPVYGLALSLAFAAGRGLPFLLLGLSAGRVSAWIDSLDTTRRRVEIVSGLALIGLTLYFFWLATVL